jgi:hypothetical protein
MKMQAATLINSEFVDKLVKLLISLVKKSLKL